MQITDYIADLLYRYECVVIPGFGAFLTQRQPAQIDEKTNAFYPPKKTISFNRQLKENDGLLANYIAKTEEISYEQSFQRIHTFIENLLEALEKGEKVNLHKIGMFYTQADKILFQPEINTNYLPEAFGTSSFVYPKINRNQQKTIAEISAEEKTEKTLVLPSTKEKIQEEENKKPIAAFWKYAAVGIVAVGLGGFLTANWYANEVKSHNIAAQEQAERQIETEIQQATFSIDDPLPSVTFKVTAKRGKYHIVAGAFRNKENADVKFEELKEKGFHPLHIGKNKFGLHQIVYDSFEERNDAINQLNKIRQNDNPGAWLLVKEL